ncbi:MAG: metallophosphoesterase [Tannerella sp.]|jgi:endonuclease/exonuclease/phosphatase family metal-dependent hydrolase/predicted phosphodiesterase|nr:metallophosphoesterase [Tannerella sp.]
MKRKILSFVIVWIFASGNFAETFAQPVSALQIPEKEANVVRMMTYNVRNACHINGVAGYQQVADIICQVKPDIAAIQELDSATQRSNGMHILNELGQRTMMYQTYASLFEYEGGKHGIGILSKEKPLKHWTVLLPGAKQVRGLLLAEFEKYVVCCTQLSLAAEEQEASVPVIFDAIKEIKKPVFLAGDMNCNFESSAQKALQSKFTALNDYRQATIPVVNEPNIPAACVDFIYGYGIDYKYSVLAQQVINLRDFDHYPVFVDVRISAPVDRIFRTEPYLQKPVDRGITISWLTHVPVHSWVEYGKNGKLDQKKQIYVDGQMLCNNEIHHFRLTDLEPGVTYSYRVCSREIMLYRAYKKEFGYTAYSDISTFTLPSADESDFTALVFNDVHKNFDLMERFARLIKDTDLKYDFVFYNGDVIDDPKDQDQAVGFMKVLNEVAGAKKVPVFYMRGNHEIRNAYSIGLRSLFDYMNGTTYGAFSWGDTRFVMLDCGEDKPDSTRVYYGLNDFNQLRDDQAVFLKNELAGEAFKQAAKKVLIHHIPVYGNEEDSYNPCREKWGDILANAPFDIAVNGHTHRFAYLPKGSEGNNFPVVIGGGPRIEEAYMLVLQKKGRHLTFRALDVEGNEKLKLEL